MYGNPFEGDSRSYFSHNSIFFEIDQVSEFSVSKRKFASAKGQVFLKKSFK